MRFDISNCVIRLLGLLGICLLFGSVSAAEAVGEAQMDKIRASNKKRVAVQIDMPADEVASLIRKEGVRCSKSEVVTTVLPVPVIVDRNMQLAEGVSPSGYHWFGFFVSNKFGGILHWPIEIAEIGPSKTTAILYDVGEKKADARKNILLSSGYFCRP